MFSIKLVRQLASSAGTMTSGASNWTRELPPSACIMVTQSAMKGGGIALSDAKDDPGLRLSRIRRDSVGVRKISFWDFMGVDGGRSDPEGFGVL